MSVETIRPAFAGVRLPQSYPKAVLGRGELIALLEIA